MRAMLTAVLVFCASQAVAQTITCLPMGQSTACYNGQGGSTIITPMGSGLYSYGNSNGQMGTIYTPPTPTPMPFTPLPSQSRPYPPSLNGQRFVR